MLALGLDYGTRHIGVALADGPLAEPLTTLPSPSALPQLRQLAAHHHVTHIVIGSGDSRLTQPISALVAALSDPHWTVHLVDETLTSRDAVRSLLHTTPARRRRSNHSVAAALILQSWLDQSSLAI